jgi:hypothetical protein
MRISESMVKNGARQAHEAPAKGCPEHKLLQGEIFENPCLKIRFLRLEIQTSISFFGRFLAPAGCPRGGNFRVSAA